MGPIHSGQLAARGERTAVRDRLAALVEEIRSQIPADVSEEEIEGEAQQAIAEVRRKRGAPPLSPTSGFEGASAGPPTPAR